MRKGKVENLALKLVWNGCSETIGSVVGLYTVIMLVIFPFYTTEQYFHILKDRARFFWVATACMAGLSMFIFLYYLARYLRERYNEGLKVISLKIPCFKSIPAWLKEHLTLMDACFLLYLCICIVSTVCSEWPADAFSGFKGRYQGCFLWLWYAAAYFMISRFLILEDKYIWLFLIAGTALSLWGITDYMGLDIFKWIIKIQKEQRGTFTSAVGNINTYTALISIFMAVSGTCYIKSREYGRRAAEKPGIFFIMFFFFLISLITGQSDNAVIGIVVFFLLVPFVFLKGMRPEQPQANLELRGIQAYLELLGLLFLSFTATFLINLTWHNPYVDPAGGILLRISSRMPIPCILFAIIFFLAAGTVKKHRHRQIKYERNWSAMNVWGEILALLACMVMIVLVEANDGGPVQIFEPLKKYLVFNDSWGTHRGFCWRLAMEHFREFPVWQKLIGSGPETYGIIVKSANYQEMLEVAGQLFDSPHNEFLQYFISTGIIGTFGYYVFLASGYIEGLFSENPVKTAAAMGVAVYTCVSFVNISVPITQPFVIILLAFIATKQIS